MEYSVLSWGFQFERETYREVTCANEQESSSICRMEVPFLSANLATILLGRLLFGFFVYWSNKQGSLNGVLLLILVFELYLESAESTQCGNENKKVCGFSIMKHRMFRIYVYLHFTVISAESTHIFFNVTLYT